MSSSPLSKDKARATARANRATLNVVNVGAALIDHFPAQFTQDRVAGFAPIQNEIDLWPLLRALHTQGRTVALPIIQASDSPLTFHHWAPGCDTQKDRHGITIPVGTRKVEPQLILVPLLAFTPRGDRLGYGGGYYDRTLAGLRAQSEIFACGVAYAGQEVKSLPTDAHDERLDGILTEDGFRQLT